MSFLYYAKIWICSFLVIIMIRVEHKFIMGVDKMKGMTSRERILAATIGQETDMVPVSPRLGAYLMSVYGDQSLAGHLNFQKKYDFDVTYTAGSGLVNPIDSVFVDTSYSKDIKLETQVWEDKWIKGSEKNISHASRKTAGCDKNCTFWSRIWC